MKLIEKLKFYLQASLGPSFTCQYFDLTLFFMVNNFQHTRILFHGSFPTLKQSAVTIASLSYFASGLQRRRRAVWLVLCCFAARLGEWLPAWVINVV